MLSHRIGFKRIQVAAGSYPMNVKLLLASLIVMKIHISQGADYPTNNKCLSDALELYERFDSIVCQNTNTSKDPSQWLQSVCKESCEIRTKSMKCAADNGIIILLKISDGLRNCSNIQSIENEGTIESSSLPNLDFTRTCTQESSSNASWYLVLAAFLGEMVGILVTLGVWLIEMKWIVRSKLWVSDGSSVHQIPLGSLNAEIPRQVLTNDVDTELEQKKTTRRDGNINNMYETRMFPDDSSSPYDHLQCITRNNIDK
ncbi:uncharacterized protein LOC128161781 [Crassostrea angulata]|uniref:uncharacterized protein LOC128161781 n=1 Tax=Magallana angulata TaxID=2784310 RepID=UPI0022B0A874|nr:uncharacterized protein LOC128161781 [Crassostrea angulata]